MNWQLKLKIKPDARADMIKRKPQVSIAILTREDRKEILKITEGWLEERLALK